MLKTSSKKSILRRRAGHFGEMVRHSVVTPTTGQTHLPKLVAHGQLGITFIGHSSFFVQIGGQNVIIDPNFARWLFVLKRLRKPGVRLRDLPPMDLVLVTHAHFDHLHRPSLRALVQLSRSHGKKPPTIVVPHHVLDLVSDLGFRNVVELNWWNSHQHAGLTITHVPSRHWGARILRDSYRGYGGYVLRDDKHSLYHAGDTAYFPGFREIGERLRPEVALLPIGAYNPASFRNVHTSPADATRGFLDLKSRWMIPMHYGTFRLSNEPMEEPLELLRAEARMAGVEDRVLILEEGVTHFF
jgi:L-ascorbate metabolism protein UlaG (beta-lactamase superfamily)